MNIEISGLGIGFAFLAVGLALMGYFIGKGLQNFGRPDKSSKSPYFIKESDLEFYLNLDQKEIKDLLNKYPDVPKVELNGTTYYPYEPLMEWVISNSNLKD